MKPIDIDTMTAVSASGRRHYMGRVRFFSRLEEIRIGIELGYSLVTLHKHYEKVFQFSYSQFSRYVTRYIKKPIPEAREVCALALASQRDRDKAPPETLSSSPVRQRQFKYRRDTPKDDLV
jgi:hypothetical protein